MPKGIYDHSMLSKSPTRFWDNINNEGSCWLWTKGKSSAGYGIFTLHKREQYYAHRWSYTQLVGEIPDGAVLDHKCNNRSCVNPKHLRITTQTYNLANTKIRSDNTSGYKGVSWDKSRGLWLAQLTKGGKSILSKRFKNLGDAVKEYRSKAKEHFGEYARF